MLTDRQIAILRSREGIAFLLAIDKKGIPSLCYENTPALRYRIRYDLWEIMILIPWIFKSGND